MKTSLGFRVLFFGLFLPLAALRSAPFPRDVSVLYSRSGAPNGTIGVVNLATGKDVTIMEGAWPSLRSDGRMLLYHIGNPVFSRANINVLDLQTGVDRLLLAGSDYIVGVDWSEDGQKVVFDYSCNIQIVNADGSGRRGFIGGDCYDDAPSVNPLDGRVVFHNANSGLYLADANGANRRRIAGSRREDVWPVWSPDADRIAFWSGTALITAKDDGTERTDLTAKAQVTATQADARAGWTPDGAWVVAATTLNGTNGLWAFAADGSAVVLIPTAPGAAVSAVGGVVSSGLVADWVSLAVSTKADHPVTSPGTTVSIEITVTNRGPGTGRGVRLTNQIPADVSAVSARVSAGKYVQLGQTIVADFGALPAGGSASCTLQLVSTNLGAHTIPITLVNTNSGSPIVRASGLGAFAVVEYLPQFAEGVFYSRRTAAGDGIWFAPADGRDEFKITDGGRPRLSPDGRSIAFVRGDVPGSRASVWVRDLVAGTEKVVFQNPGDFVVGLTWSAAGQRVIFDFSCAIYARTRIGADAGVFIGGDCYYDAPSVQMLDGRVAFHSANFGLLVADREGKNVRGVPNTRPGDYWPVWSATGDWLVFVSAGNIWKIRPDGTERTRLTTVPDTGDKFENPVAWSPTGQAIIAAGRVSGQFGLYSVDSSGVGSLKRWRGLPADSQAPDVGAAVGQLIDGIRLSIDLELSPSGATGEVLITGPSFVPYVIEASTDFSSWVRVFTNDPAAMKFYQPDFNAFRSQFFRGFLPR